MHYTSKQLLGSNLLLGKIHQHYKCKSFHPAVLLQGIYLEIYFTHVQTKYVWQSLTAAPFYVKAEILNKLKVPQQKPC